MATGNSTPSFPRTDDSLVPSRRVLPLFRLHGHCLPNSNDFNGAANEIWSFGDEAYEILKRYMFLRERLRPLFLDSPNDPLCYSIEDEYLFGPELLVAPVLEAETCSRKVYLPANSTWKDAWTGRQYEGGQWIDVPAPLETMPLFLKTGSDLLEIFQR